MDSQGTLLTDYLKQWNAYSVGLEFCHALFRYLNMNWIKKRLDDSRNKMAMFANTSDIYEVGTLALVVWRDRLFKKIKDRLLRAVLDVVCKDRDGEMSNIGQVTGVVNSYVKLGSINKNKPLELYREDFEDPFMANLREYYGRESSQYITQHGVSQYMKQAQVRLEEEAIRGKKILDPSSLEKLKTECDLALIDKHKEMLQIECEHYLRDEKIEDLNRMYNLLNRLDNGIRPMLDVVENFVAQTGFDAIRAIPAKERTDPKKYVETLLETYNHFNTLIKKAFNNDNAFGGALDKACRRVVNENSIGRENSKSPEFLAKYCNLLLKKGAKNLEEAELEEAINQTIIVFKYVDDKDVFQKFYAKMLARRLIHNTSVSDDAESVMLGGLKQACGFEYTSKLQRMFTDITLSKDITEKFRGYLTDKSIELKVDFTVMVLTAGSWPLQTQTSSFNIPKELEGCLTHFQNYYNSQHQGRKLNWSHHLCKGDLKTNFFKKKYELSVSNYQMAILLLFNDADTLTYDNLVTLTNLKEVDLKANLDSLLESKVLLGTAATQFSVNPNFTRSVFQLESQLEFST
eukprot:TRINITY_DN3292_c1_g1_i4.p1 TRINITY_DN3292_c1_g1~~TRINITY_DN3292_c1_g1_i4.p1  ORF type:complete len:651 (-),score=202.85 TRINITY_DN3292_c1_g1_i4:48-1769(-)